MDSQQIERANVVQSVVYPRPAAPGDGGEAMTGYIGRMPFQEHEMRLEILYADGARKLFLLNDQPPRRRSGPRRRRRANENAVSVHPLCESERQAEDIGLELPDPSR